LFQTKLTVFKCHLADEARGATLKNYLGPIARGVNRKKQKSSSIPRHQEIIDFLAKKICRGLEILET